MTTEETFNLLREILIEHHDVAPELIQRERPVAELGFDSLSMIEVLYQIEERLGIPAEGGAPKYVPPTIGEVADMISQHLSERAVVAG